jgi:beta-lactamase regulating signal transducer with metallopeptidase domain
MLTFLLNACWQILLITALASLGSWLLRHSSARYRHWVWVSALLLSFLIPLAASSRILFAGFVSPPVASNTVAIDPEAVFESSALSTAASSELSSSSSAILLNQGLALGVIAVYLGFLLFSSFRLYSAWSTTRRIKQTAESIVSSDAIAKIVERCRNVIGNRRIEILCSSAVPVPVTMGIFKPLIILPEQLALEGDENLLTSAIAHEAIHVARRDYVLNLFYELIYVSLSFHPAAALIRRRVKQTRELSCDELVAQRVLEPEVYARSLVTLASSAPTPRRLSVTATVGIADADILEVRIMSLMKKSKLDTRSRKILLIGVAMLLIVSSVTTAAFAMRFDVEPLGVTQEQEKQKEKEKEKQKIEKQSREFREGMEAGEREALHKRLETLGQERAGEREALQKRLETLDPERSAEREALQKRLETLGQERAGELEALQKRLETLGSERAGEKEALQTRLESVVRVFEARNWRIEEELKARDTMQAAMLRLARIRMDQAIQIALSQQPGQVIQSSLGAKGWEEPGKLAVEGEVFYHVIVLSGDENSPMRTHVWVNAIDGTIIKTEKELPRKMRKEEP